MARVTGPLFSFHAVGSIARRITFRAMNGYQVVSKQGKATTKPTLRQLDYRDRYRWAAAAWATLSPKARNEWTTAAAQFRLPQFAIFTREFVTQRCGENDLPLIPAIG